MLKCDRMNIVRFLNEPHYQTYLKGKECSYWDKDLNWDMARNDNLNEDLKSLAVDVASMSAHVEILGMQNAAELLSQCSDFALKISLGQAVNDEARHAELFAKYATIANGYIKDFSKTQEVYDEHFNNLNTFDEVFLSHVFLENGALEQFNVFVNTFGEDSLIGQIYKGALQDESRHVQMGIQYFKRKILLEHGFSDFIYNHLNNYRNILHMNQAAIDWFSQLSGISSEQIKDRIEKRHDSFINRMIKVE